MKQGGGDGVLLSRRLQSFLGFQGGGLGSGGGAGGCGDGAIRLGQFGSGSFGGQPCIIPAHEQQSGLQGTDLCADFLVAFGLTRLALEPVQGGLQLAPDVVQPLQIGLGRLQPQLGLVPPGVQPRHAPGLFQDATPVLGLGGDQLADLALTDQGRAVGPGRCVGEQ